jgi:SPP1 family predicted phage head-tail adaptor|tara:strand:+ start:784 stop:1113 length:330 start_codon:yes stop_codon:yes gene_type:complete
MSNSIGKMRYRVKVENATNTRDAGGGLSQAYTVASFVYANIKPTSANSTYRQGIVLEKVTHEVTMRYMTNISTNSRVSYGSRNFNVRGIVNVDERDRFLKLLCEEGVAI